MKMGMISRLGSTLLIRLLCLRVRHVGKIRGESLGSSLMGFSQYTEQRIPIKEVIEMVSFLKQQTNN